ncbi:MAG: hypothetical protein ACK56I_11760, partial [bacterium]
AQDIRSQPIAPSTPIRPISGRGDLLPVESGESVFTTFDSNVEQSRRPRVLSQQTSHVTLHGCGSPRLFRAALRHGHRAFLNPLFKPLENPRLLVDTVATPAQQEDFALRWGSDPGYAFPTGMFRPGGCSEARVVDRGFIWGIRHLAHIGSDLRAGSTHLRMCRLELPLHSSITLPVCRDARALGSPPVSTSVSPRGGVTS